MQGALRLQLNCEYLPATGHPMEMLQTAIASLGMFYQGDE